MRWELLMGSAVSWSEVATNDGPNFLLEFKSGSLTAPSFLLTYTRSVKFTLSLFFSSILFAPQTPCLPKSFTPHANSFTFVWMVLYGRCYSCMSQPMGTTHAQLMQYFVTHFRCPCLPCPNLVSLTHVPCVPPSAQMPGVHNILCPWHHVRISGAPPPKCLPCIAWCPQYFVSLTSCQNIRCPPPKCLQAVGARLRVTAVRLGDNKAVWCNA